jgi:hypothetical protein
MPVPVGVPAEKSEHEDLAEVLSNIGWGKLSSTRARLANSDATREFLDLGLGLLQDDLIMHTGPNFDEGERSRLFESLSRERILKRATELDPDQRKLYTANMFRHRWERKDRYTEDLISYLFRPGPQQRHMAEMEEGVTALMAEVSLKELIQHFAAAEVGAMLAAPNVRLQDIVWSALPNHPRVQSYTQAQYSNFMPMWAALYERVATAYGLTLRPGYTWLDIADLFNTVTEGAVVRARVNRVEAVLSNGAGILASSILAMMPSLLDGLPGDFGTLYITGISRT